MNLVFTFANPVVELNGPFTVTVTTPPVSCEQAELTILDSYISSNDSLEYIIGHQVPVNTFDRTKFTSTTTTPQSCDHMVSYIYQHGYPVHVLSKTSYDSSIFEDTWNWLNDSFEFRPSYTTDLSLAGTYEFTLSIQYCWLWSDNSCYPDVNRPKADKLFSITLIDECKVAVLTIGDGIMDTEI